MHTYIVGILSKDLLECGKIYRNKYADEKMIFALDMLKEYDHFTWKGKIKALMLRIASFFAALTPGFCLFDKMILNEDDKLVIASRELFYETIRKHVCKATTKKIYICP